MVWRGNGILLNRKGRSGIRGQNACGTAKNYAVRIGKRGGGGKVRTSGPGRTGQVRILGGRGAGTDLLKKVKA